MSKTKITGTIDRVVRANGKPTKILVIIDPGQKTEAIPMGSVEVEIEALQTELFAGPGRPDGTGARPPKH